MKQEIRERIEKIRKGEVPEGYRKTNVGIIPVDWEVVNLKHSFLLKGRIGWQGLTTKEYLTNGDYYLITGTDFENGKINWKNCAYVSEDRYLQDKNIQIKTNDILVTKDGTIGKIAYISNVLKPTTLNSGVFVLRPLNGLYNPKWVYYLLESIIFKKFIHSLKANSTISHLYQKDFENFKFIRGEIKEQEKIVEILSTWDKAIELKEKLIEEKKDFKRGLIQKLLVGKLRFKEHVNNSNLQEVKRYGILPEEWSVKKANSIFSNISKKNNGNEQLLSATQDNGVIPRDMLDGDVMSPSGDTNSYKLVEEGDFVISLRSFQGGLEYSCYRGMVSPAYTVLKNKIPICKDFYRHLFKSRLFIDRLASSVIGIRDGKQISYEEFSIMLLPYPELKEQEKIASMLNNIDNNIELIKLELNQLKEQKRGLKQLLLTGIVRVEVD